MIYLAFRETRVLRVIITNKISDPRFISAFILPPLKERTGSLST
jgi:hypothetical protein